MAFYLSFPRVLLLPSLSPIFESSFSTFPGSKNGSLCTDAPQIPQMMYIAGETQDVSTPTIKLVEDIIRDQVVHIVPL